MTPPGRSPRPAATGGDRAFTIAFGASLGLHLFVLLGAFVSLSWLAPFRARGPLEVIYEYEVAKRELEQLNRRLAQARQTTEAPSPRSASRDGQIRVPERPVLATTRALPDILSRRAAVVDLTDLSEASQGDPVLLSYFSALREEIQRTANQQSWPGGEGQEGLVYVSFVLTATGQVRRAAVVRQRSAGSAALREIAIEIVKAAAPFPPFPPSMTEETKTIVVPLEFLLGQ